MDHSVKAMPPASSRQPLRALLRFANRHRFENDELENLYQRYVYKLQHSSVTAVVALSFTYAHGLSLQVVSVTFVAYAMLPLRTYVAALFSTVLAAAHLTTTAIWAKDFPWLT